MDWARELQTTTSIKNNFIQWIPIIHQRQWSRGSLWIIMGNRQWIRVSILKVLVGLMMSQLIKDCCRNLIHSTIRSTQVSIWKSKRESRTSWIQKRKNSTGHLEWTLQAPIKTTLLLCQLQKLEICKSLWRRARTNLI